MKFVNHEAIYFYLAAGKTELDILMKYLLLLGAAMLFCIFSLGVGLKKYENSVISQKVDILSLHSCMNNQLLRDLTDYYLYLK
jgi:alpha-glucosidase (family GH31 glycosyl hydrolase)